jgi:hypothetical protein
MSTGATEFAHRSSAGIDVSLVWLDGGDRAVVRVCDEREGAYFEIPTEPHLALDVYYHPFFYRDFSRIEIGTADLQPFEQREEERNGRGWLHRSRR